MPRAAVLMAGIPIGLSRLCLIMSLIVITLLACSGQSELDKLATYFEEIKVMDAATAAGEERIALLDEHSTLDYSTLTREEADEIIRAELSATTKEQLATQEARKAFQLIVPPEQCEEQHLTQMESLEWTEQALGYTEQAYEHELRTGRQERDLLARANRLFVQINRLHQQGLFTTDECK